MAVTDISPEQRKAQLRTRLRAARKARSSTQRARDEQAIAAQIVTLAEQQSVGSLAAFLSAPTEPPTAALLHWAADCQMPVLLPRTRPDGALDWVWAAEVEDTITHLGIPEAQGPLAEAQAIEHVDLIIIPALAVSPRGARLGQGGGFYDRTLAALSHVPPTAALVFDEEVLDDLPLEPHDHPIDMIITPKRVITCARAD